MTRNCHTLLGYLQQLLDQGTANGELTARHVTLEREVGIPYASIKRTIREATELGLLEITAAKRGSATTYKLLGAYTTSLVAGSADI